MPLNLNIPQSKFIKMKKPFRAYVAGYRGGKTYVGCVRMWLLALAYPNIKLGYFAPTYPQITDIFYDTIGEVAAAFSHHVGVECWVDIRVSDKVVYLMVGSDCYASVKCRSMDNPSRIVGFNINHALIDEIDTMKKKKADDAWKKIIARMSTVRAEYPVNTADFTTTPEGFNWMYDFFIKQVQEKPELAQFYDIIQASTLENAKNLPSDYIDKLYATYPENLVAAYVNGEFVNLTSGQVYRQFDRILNSTDIIENSNDTLHIGMDFNVGKMSAVVHVERNQLPVAVNEIFGCLDTPDMIAEIKRLYPNRKIYVYPDSSGKNRKSNEASKTDISELQNAGFELRYKSVNPRVRDRINGMNAMFCNGANERRYLINTNRCKRYTDDLEQQVYNKQGEPDKAHDNDHMNDAGGYYIAYCFPVNKPTGDIKFGLF